MMGGGGLWVLGENTRGALFELIHRMVKTLLTNPSRRVILPMKTTGASRKGLCRLFVTCYARMLLSPA